MKQQILALGLGVGAILLTVLPMQAQVRPGGNCAAYDSVVAQLASKYGEVRQSIGLAANNQVVEVFASLQTGSWTIIVTRPSGIACLVAAGQSFEVLNQEPSRPLPDEPA